MLLYQPKLGYCYNSDSLFLYDFINSFEPKGRVLDVGAGCGIVGLLIARDNKKVVLEAVEKQSVFIEYAKINARVNKIEYRLYENDFLEFESDEKYDYIISNPPFYPDGVKKSDDDIILNARYSSNLPLKYFFKKVSQLLKPHSHFIFCYDPLAFSEICVGLEMFKMKVVDVRFVHSKIDRDASLVMIHARNGSKSMMKVRAPLMCFENDKASKMVQKIYEKAKTQSIKCQI